MKNSDPDVVRTPAVSILSFIAIGTPCNSPNQRPSAAALSARSAWRRASSAVTVIKELILSSLVSIAFKQVSTTFREDRSVDIFLLHTINLRLTLSHSFFIYKFRILQKLH